MKAAAIALAIWHGFVDDAETRAEQRVQRAMERVARCAGEAEFHSMMANFHTDRVVSIDPMQDHWGFASNRQKQLDHQEDWAYEDKRLAEARAVLEARLSALQQIRDQKQEK